MERAKGFGSEREMQSAFSNWICTEAGNAWVLREREAEGLPGEVVAGAFELKHVACEGKQKRGRGRASICTEAECAKPLVIGEHEYAQAEGLARASGSAQFGTRRLSWCHKLPDIGSGYRPVDCVLLGRGTLARFVLGWSCPAKGFVAYAVAWDKVTAWRDAGHAVVREGMAKGWEAEGQATHLNALGCSWGSRVGV